MLKTIPKKYLLIICIAAIVAYNLINQITTSLQSDDRLAQATEQLHNLENENRQLNDQLKEVGSSWFVEQQARDQLGLARSGETVVIIPEEKLNQVLGAAKTTQPPRLPNWQGWLKLFFR